MAVRKKAIAPPSCPMWLATYGDLVTNVLVFFVLLVSMSEVKTDDRFEAFLQALQEAFGYVGGFNQAPFEELIDVKNAPLAELLVVPIDPKELGRSDERGVRGRHEAVTRLRPGERYDQGGKFRFSELSAELTPENEALIAGYAEKVRGLRTQIEVRGHCNPRPVDGTGLADHFELSYRRARAVADALVRHGIAPERLVLVAAGTNEPIAVGSYTPPEREANDLVEVLQVNRRVDEFTAPTAGAAADDARD